MMAAADRSQDKSMDNSVVRDDISFSFKKMKKRIQGRTRAPGRKVTGSLSALGWKKRNISVNSTNEKQSLRSNNRSLATALEIVRQQNRDMQRKLIELQTSELTMKKRMVAVRAAFEKLHPLLLEASSTTKKAIGLCGDNQGDFDGTLIGSVSQDDYGGTTVLYDPEKTFQTDFPMPLCKIPHRAEVLLEDSALPPSGTIEEAVMSSRDKSPSSVLKRKSDEAIEDLRASALSVAGTINDCKAQLESVELPEGSSDQDPLRLFDDFPSVFNDDPVDSQTRKSHRGHKRSKSGRRSVILYRPGHVDDNDVFDGADQDDEQSQQTRRKPGRMLLTKNDKIGEAKESLATDVQDTELPEGTTESITQDLRQADTKAMPEEASIVTETVKAPIVNKEVGYKVSVSERHDSESKVFNPHMEIPRTPPLHRTSMRSQSEECEEVVEREVSAIEIPRFISFEPEKGPTDKAAKKKRSSILQKKVKDDKVATPPKSPEKCKVKRRTYSVPAKQVEALDQVEADDEDIVNEKEITFVDDSDDEDCIELEAAVIPIDVEGKCNESIYAVEDMDMTSVVSVSIEKDIPVPAAEPDLKMATKKSDSTQKDGNSCPTRKLLRIPKMKKRKKQTREESRGINATEKSCNVVDTETDALVSRNSLPKPHEKFRKSSGKPKPSNIEDKEKVKNDQDIVSSHEIQDVASESSANSNSLSKDPPRKSIGRAVKPLPKAKTSTIKTKEKAKDDRESMSSNEIQEKESDSTPNIDNSNSLSKDPPRKSTGKPVKPLTKTRTSTIQEKAKNDRERMSSNKVQEESDSTADIDDRNSLSKDPPRKSTGKPLTKSRTSTMQEKAKDDRKSMSSNEIREKEPDSTPNIDDGNNLSKDPPRKSTGKLVKPRTKSKMSTTQEKAKNDRESMSSNKVQEIESDSTADIDDSNSLSKDPPRRSTGKPVKPLTKYKTSAVQKEGKLLAKPKISRIRKGVKSLSSDNEKVTLKILPKARCQIVFKAGRKNPSEIESREHNKFFRNQTVEDPLPQPVVTEGKNTGSIPAQKVTKDIFDMSLNESVTVLPQMKYGDFRDNKETMQTMKQRLNTDQNGESVGDGSPHGIMLVTGAGKRTKPRQRNKSVTYSRKLAEVRLTSPSATDNDESSSPDRESVKVYAGATPPRPKPTKDQPEEDSNVVPDTPDVEVIRKKSRQSSKKSESRVESMNLDDCEGEVITRDSVGSSRSSLVSNERTSLTTNSESIPQEASDEPSTATTCTSNSPKTKTSPSTEAVKRSISQSDFKVPFEVGTFAEPKRPRRGASQKSYKELSLNTKLRRGDPISTTLYKEGEHNMDSRGKRKSGKQSRDALSTITNVT